MSVSKALKVLFFNVRKRENSYKIHKKMKKSLSTENKNWIFEKSLILKWKIPIIKSKVDRLFLIDLSEKIKQLSYIHRISERRDEMGVILAQYTIRSKQEYIFRTNRVVEIAGASENISRSWEILFQQAKRSGKKVRRVSDAMGFQMKEIEDSFKKNELHMVELFCGGGNDTVLYDSLETYKEVNRAFSRYLLEQCPGMIPMAVQCEYTGNYQNDYRNLMLQADKEKNRMTPGQSCFILPFSMMDRTVFQPYSDITYIDENAVRVTDEGKSKREKGLKIREKDSTIKKLDKLVTKKGEESLLAVVHADGNNMGVKIGKMLQGETAYDICVTKMRKFTTDTADAFVKDGLEAMKCCQKELQEKYRGKYKEESFLYRKIIADGDDMTFICNARFVIEYVKAYLDAVQKHKEKKQSEWDYSSCAGICIFHSHYPFAKAYSLAEQACDSAKKKEHGEEVREESWMDFHYIHNGVGGKLEQIRKRQGVAEYMARPWRMDTTATEQKDNFQQLLHLDSVLKNEGVSRSDIKTIGAEVEEGFSFGEKEMIRVFGHHKKLKESLGYQGKTEDMNQLLRMIYDLAEVYDLWFARA